MGRGALPDIPEPHRKTRPAKGRLWITLYMGEPLRNTWSKIAPNEGGGGGDEILKQYSTPRRYLNKRPQETPNVSTRNICPNNSPPRRSLNTRPEHTPECLDKYSREHCLSDFRAPAAKFGRNLDHCWAKFGQSWSELLPNSGRSWHPLRKCSENSPGSLCSSRFGVFQGGLSTDRRGGEYFWCML